MKKWSNNICRVGQGDEHTWVTGPCCIILRTWCVFGKKWPFWPLWPWMTFDPVKGHMTYAGWVIDHCDQVSLKSIKAARRYIRFYGWQKKKKKKNHRKTEYRRMWMRLYKEERKRNTLETSLICILLSASRDVHFVKRMICFLSGLF